MQKVNNFFLSYASSYIQNSMTKTKFYLWSKLTNVLQTLQFYAAT